MSEPPPEVSRADLMLPAPEELNAASLIDPDVLAKWFELPHDAPVNLSLSRNDVDQLFLGLRHMIFAQGDMMQALRLTTNGEFDEANVAFAKAAQRHLLATRQITTFTTLVMMRTTSDGR